MTMKSRSRYLAVSLIIFLSIAILGGTGCLQAAEPTVKATTNNPKMEFDPHHAALLILHYQNDLLNPKGKFGPNMPNDLQSRALLRIPKSYWTHAGRREYQSYIISLP